jgi:hypothetical protein
MKKPNRTHRPNRPHNVRRQARPQRDPACARHDHTDPGYLARVVAAAFAGGVVKSGQVTIVNVHHDDRCRAHVGPCIGKPDIECAAASGNVHVVGADGEVTSRTRLN